MQPSLIDTAAVRPADQYAWFTGELDRIFGIKSYAVEKSSGPFQGRVDVLSLPPLTYLAFSAENNGGVRLGQQIRRVEWGHYCIYREMGEGILFELAGKTFATSCGDLVIYDGDAPMRSQAKTRFGHVIWMVPRATLDAYLPPLPRPLVVHIPASLGVTALATAYVDALVGSLKGLDHVEAALVADNLCRLIALACGAGAKPHGEVVKVAKLDQARAFVESRLTRPALDPEMAANALGISVRALHLLFEPTGESFSQFVRRRRLQECRATLESPLSAGRSVTDIAYGWGFTSLPTFYRAFQAAFGQAPGDLRDAILRGRLR